VNVGAKLQPEERAQWSDERLVSECLKRNEQAWSALIEKYKNLIYSIPIKLGLYEDAADIFQAVCADLLADLPRLREPRALPKWLMQVCYHKCLQYRRKSEKQVSPAENTTNEGLVIPDEHAVHFEELTAQVEREQMLRNAMAELNPRCQRLVRMLFFETPPRPYQEIAKELDLASGSIGFIRGRCLTKLRKQLEKMGF
jgi:RNA polymerase sigma factor (sigma-70 family)